MSTEISAGGVVYFETGKGPEYLILHYDAGHWGFPKGKLEEGESNEQAMLREIEEETGITKTHIHPEFNEKITYFYTRDKQTIFKQVFFFIAKCDQKEVTLSHEHQDFKWLKYEDALNQLSFKNQKELLTKAHHIIS